jgi:hypothetical protein
MKPEVLTNLLGYELYKNYLAGVTANVQNIRISEMGRNIPTGQEGLLNGED